MSPPPPDRMVALARAIGPAVMRDKEQRVRVSSIWFLWCCGSTGREYVAVMAENDPDPLVRKIAREHLARQD